VCSEEGVVYGQKKEQGEAAVFMGHAMQLQPLVAELSLLEDAAQKSFWSLKDKYSRKKGAKAL
jgi:hypothetical protein